MKIRVHVDGEELNLELFRTTYERDDSVAVMVYEDGDMYCDLTKWVGFCGEKSSHIDGNSDVALAIMKELSKQGLLYETGLFTPSGFCKYPLVIFTDKFLEKCEEVI